MTDSVASNGCLALLKSQKVMLMRQMFGWIFTRTVSSGPVVDSLLLMMSTQIKRAHKVGWPSVMKSVATMLRAWPTSVFVIMALSETACFAFQLVSAI